MKVLMLTHRVPYPADRGDRIRALAILKHLSQRFDVSLACVSDEPVTRQQIQAMEGLSNRFAVQRINPRYGKLRGLARLATGGAITPGYFYRPALAKVIKRWHGEQPFDSVFTYCTGMIDYARLLTKQPGGRRRTDTHDLNGNKLIRHVIDLVDVDSAKWDDYAKQSLPPLRWLYNTEAHRIRAIEAGDRDRYDAIAVVSAAEARLYREQVGNHLGLTVLRHAVDVDYFQPQPDDATQSLLFTGVLDYRPNVEGIAWFVERVWPRLRWKMPRATLRIVGRSPSRRVKALAKEDGVTVIGPVPDVRHYLATATATIAPLHIARGVQTKVLEAMASARVAVCSPGAAEGIYADDGEHLLVADSPEHWVAQLQRVLTDGELRQRIASNARQRVESVYPWERCLEPLESLLTGKPLVRQTPGVMPLRKAA